ncbi:hypothetical protein P7K49_031459 [Saguinus oedipus]|uniref:Oxysterol-binding protein n=1 Tax=Saguinus oedipus TaxID=9490 RepID=A0ABQ9U0L7_SAGOE|nr:hypothetical protein P7K49_031459 [Saguinus oedipus]
MAPLLCSSSVDIRLLMGLPPPGAGPFPQSYPSSVMAGLVHHSSNSVSQCTLSSLVVLPTFILEKRSLLEMYADFMAHPDLLLAITAGATPEERVICFVEYYLTAFHEGRKGALAKKPYNPIIGETFHCSWEVPKDKVKPKRTAPHSPASCCEHPTADDPSKSYKLRFVAEQVSHHPPISCFYCECKEKRLCVNTHVWTKSKFMGMSVGVSMIGEAWKRRIGKVQWFGEWRRESDGRVQLLQNAQPISDESSHPHFTDEEPESGSPPRDPCVIHSHIHPALRTSQ